MPHFSATKGCSWRNWSGTRLQLTISLNCVDIGGPVKRQQSLTFNFSSQTLAINISSYRDDSSAKPPSSSRTLQNRTPFTNGTDESSSKSKSTRNLNLFFLLRMKDMLLSRRCDAGQLKPSPAAAPSAVAARYGSLLSPTTSADTAQSSNLLLHVVWWRHEQSNRWLASGAARKFRIFII